MAEHNAHEKVHVICENLCLEEGMTKQQIENKFATQEVVESLINGSPKGYYETINALKTANPDTGVYLVTNNGHIYSWTKNQSGDPIDLGVYQAAVNPEIESGSISISNLNDDLQENFNKEEEKIEFLYDEVGYCRIVNNQLSIENDNQYRYGIISLEKNEEYKFIGYNFYSVLGIIIVDSLNNNSIVKSSLDDLTNTGIRSTSLYIKPSKAGLKAYISIGYNIGSYSNYVKAHQMLTKIKRISIDYKEEKTSLINTIANYFGDKRSSVGNEAVTSNANGYKIKIYTINKGVKYKIKSYNQYSVAGLILTDLNNKVIYSSSDSSVEGAIPFDYEFTANQNGYALITDNETPQSAWSSSIEIINYLNNYVDYVDGKYAEIMEYIAFFEKYKNKKWVALGDSLTDPNTLGVDVKNYVDYVKDDLKLNAVNLAKSGSGYWRRNNENLAFYQKAELIPEDTDVVTIFGSWNDFSTQEGVTGTQIIGQVTDTTTDTICGCINTTLDTIFARCPNAVVGVISPTPWYNHHGYVNYWDDKYLKPLKTICINRSIPFLDLYEASNLMPWVQEFNEQFYKNADGTHPNTLGHKRIAGLIENFIKGILY